jgi:hypothetical protein
MGSCYFYRQFCSLGPLPPRAPAQQDPQVPKDYELGPCSHGKIGAFYFYADGSKDDPPFASARSSFRFSVSRRTGYGLNSTASPMAIRARGG